MNDNKVTILGFLFFLFCAALIGGVFFIHGQLTQLQGAYDELEQRRVDLNQTTQALIDQKKVFSDAFTTLEGYKIGVATDEMEFYSKVQQAVQAIGINILSTRQQGVSPDGRSSMALTLKGDYYSLLQVLAKWRNLDVTVRVSAFTVTASKNPETRGEVQAEVTVETIISGKM